MNLAILYEDNHLLAVNKPPGLLTQASGRDADSIEDQARQYVKRTCGKPGGVFLHAVHRLDAPTSGVVLLARTDKALGRLQQALRERRVGKIYHAVVARRPPADEGRLEHHLRHGDRHAQAIGPAHPEARLAILDYRVLGRAGEGWLVEVSIRTGRYHQIRAQLAAVGAPILGDTVYGAPPLPAYPGIWLHHRRMVVPHPTLRTPLTIEAPYPPGWPASSPPAD
ncbi:MAG: Ribosomal large subunit pseudouridine synthase A [Lentisphaerae bacterium ADurb.BinA184]|nr:MAG: Ribosomal large subunit pseudouridine synthase A [Lentisphaerae bacterium ADurb.BinA184]